jgi:hypothetical protein
VFVKDDEEKKAAYRVITPRRLKPGATEVAKPRLRVVPPDKLIVFYGNIAINPKY